MGTGSGSYSKQPWTWSKNCLHPLYGQDEHVCQRVAMSTGLQGNRSHPESCIAALPTCVRSAPCTLIIVQ